MSYHLTGNMANCSSCGESIPEGQGSSCSMCYGDPAYGRDGYYYEHLLREEQESLQRHEEAVKQQIIQMILAGSRYKKLTWDNGL
jgi:hypothetical protein